MADTFQLEIVAADRTVWSGEATMVITRTTEGEIGVLANHAPVLAVLAPGAIDIRPAEGARMLAFVDGGFLSVAKNRVSALAEHAELADEIDLAEAQATLNEVRAQSDDSPRARKAIAVAEARVLIAEKAS